MPLGVRRLSSSTASVPSSSRTTSKPAIPIQRPPGGRRCGEQRLVVLRAAEHARRDDALGDDPLRPVDVGDEGVERAQALLEPAAERVPLVARRSRAARDRPRTARAPSASGTTTPRARTSSCTSARGARRLVRRRAWPGRPRPRGAGRRPGSPPRRSRRRRSDSPPADRARRDGDVGHPDRMPRGPDGRPVRSANVRRSRSTGGTTRRPAGGRAAGRYRRRRVTPPRPPRAVPPCWSSTTSRPCCARSSATCAPASAATTASCARRPARRRRSCCASCAGAARPSRSCSPTSACPGCRASTCSTARARALPAAPSARCSPPTPTRTRPSRRSTARRSTTTCRSRGTRPRSALYPTLDDLLGDWQADARARATPVARVVGHRFSPRVARRARLPRPQPRPVRVARRRPRRGGAGGCSTWPGIGADRLPAVFLPRRPRARARRPPLELADRLGLTDPGRARLLRPGDRRRRPGRARRRGLRRLGGAAHRARRARGARRPGRAELADRELPRLPERPLGRRPRAPRARPGAPLRRRAAHRAARCDALEARGPAARGAARGRRRARRPHACSWPPASPTAGSTRRAWRSSTAAASTTAPRSSRPTPARTSTSSSSAARTRPARPRSSSPRSAAPGDDPRAAATASSARCRTT